MALRLYFTFLLVIMGSTLFGQPMVSHFLAPQADISRGRNFQKIEELSEVIIRGVAPIPHRVEKHFNSDGFIVSQVALNSVGGRTSETKWEYAKGRSLVRKHHRFFMNISGWSEEEVLITRDDMTLIPTKIEVLKNGKMWQWALTMMDTLGRIESARVFGSTGAHVFSERFMYLEPSNMIRVMVYRANGLFVSTSTYPIDPKKEFTFESVSRQFYPNGDIMLETLSTAGKGDQAYFYEYEYDGQGNWIEKRTYQVKLGRNNRISNKNLENRVTRKITYQ